MNKLQTVLSLVVILAFLLLLKIGCSREKALKERDRWQDNYQSEAKAGMGLVKKLSIDDLLDLRPDLKTLIEDSIKARPKEIESIITTKVVYKIKTTPGTRDTVIVYLDKKYPAKVISYKDQCSSVTAIISDSMTIGSLEIDQSINIAAITKWNRKHKALWGLIKYGRKIYSTKYVSTCPGVLFEETESIKVIKD
jgi:hypothetical protein